jgi:hypothetical protein
VLELIRRGLRALASQDPRLARQLLADIAPTQHPAALYLHLETIAAGGATFADVISPLLKLPGLFTAGAFPSRWKSATEALSATLSHLHADERRDVLTAILSHWPEITRAKKRAHRAHRRLINSSMRHRVRAQVLGVLLEAGREQLHILNALDECTLTAQALRRKRELERKFAHVTQGVARPKAKTDAPVGLTAEQTEHMTDEQWLKAMAVYGDPDSPPAAQGKRGRATRSAKGGRSLAQALTAAVRHQPDRFISLFASLPADVPVGYRRAILIGLIDSKESPERAGLLAVLAQAHESAGRPFGREICDLILAYTDLGRNDAAFERLTWYVRQGEADDDSGLYDTGLDTLSLRELFCIDLDELLPQKYLTGGREIWDPREVALEALSEVVRNVPERLPDAIALINERVQHENQTNIRCTLIDPINSVYRHDPTKASDLLSRLIRTPDPPNLAPLTTRIGVRLMRDILVSSPATARELLDLMFASGYREVRRIAAFHVYLQTFRDEDFAPEAQRALQKSPRLRTLAAHVAACKLRFAADRNWASTQLTQFFNDSQIAVRKRAARCFRQLHGEGLEKYQPAVTAFLHSAAFEDDCAPLFRLLREANFPPPEMVLAAMSRLFALCETSAEKRRVLLDRAGSLRELFAQMYLRLENPDERSKVLYVLDRMYEFDPTEAEEAVAAFERQNRPPAPGGSARTETPMT